MTKGPATRNDFVNDIVDDARADAIFATLKTTISSTISLRVAGPLSMSVIKKVIQPITLPLTAIFNMSFQTGVFPSSMKLAKIIPVFKSGSKAEFNNYRPISLLSQFSKILEKLYNKRLEQFIEKTMYYLTVNMAFDHLCPPQMH